MLKAHTLIYPLLLASTCWAGVTSNFDFDWQFKYYGRNHHNNVKPAPEAQFGYNTEGYKDVQLPHDWAIESPFLVDEPNQTGKLPWPGSGWYRKTIDIDSSFDNKTQRYYLNFDGVMAFPKVYVNGQLAGEWAYGYNAFQVDITPFLKAGEKNLIAVNVTNWILSSRWYPGSGIYRHVELEKTAPVHIDHWGVQVQTKDISKDKATILIATTVKNTTNKEAEVRLQQAIAGQKTASEAQKIAPNSSIVVEQSITLDKPELWDTENPHLYELESRLAVNGKAIDSKTTSFGVRDIAWTTEGFFLNGKRVELKGVCEHHDLGALGSAFYERGMERKIEILKEMGCNSIRTAHNPPAKGMLDLCDKHGILVIAELFDMWTTAKGDRKNGYSSLWDRWWQRDVRNFVVRDRNHPCIIAWSSGNEIPEAGNPPKGIPLAENLKKEFYKYDPTRAHTSGINNYAATHNGFGDVMDCYGFNYKPWAYNEYHALRPNMPFYGSETASCVATRDTYFFPFRWDKSKGLNNMQVSAYGIYAPGWASCPDVEFKGLDTNKNVAGEYVWTGFDYIGEPTPYNKDETNINNFINSTEEEKKAAMEELARLGNKAPSRSSYFGIIDLAGFPKDTYYLYQSRWAPEKKHAHILPHWNWAGREGEVTPVMVFSSGDEAELFLNGKSQGVRKKRTAEEDPSSVFTQNKVTVGKNEYRFSWEDVLYEAGELKVIVKKDGKPWAEATRVTTGDTTTVSATPDRASIKGDGHDLSHISLATCDAKGNIVPTDCRKVSFSITGPAKLIGFCNGNPIDHTCMQDMNQHFFNGRLLAIVRGERGQSGKATIRVEAEGLPPYEITINVQDNS